MSSMGTEILANIKAYTKAFVATYNAMIEAGADKDTARDEARTLAYLAISSDLPLSSKAPKKMAES